MLLLRYSQRWAKALSRNSLDLQLYAAQVAALTADTGPKPLASSLALSSSIISIAVHDSKENYRRGFQKPIP